MTSQLRATLSVGYRPKIWRTEIIQVHVSEDNIRTVRAVDIPPSLLPTGAARLQLKLFGLSANNMRLQARR